MDPAQYTPDVICRAMGLPAFVERDLSPVAIRLLLMPSFDPEVCVTFTCLAGDARLSVVALAEMLWRQSAPRALPAWREQVAVPAPLLAQAVVNFVGALTEDRLPKGRMVCLDGMPIAASLLSSAGLEQFACSPYRPAVSAFVSSLIRVAWESCIGAGVRNALAACSRYVGLDFPREPVPLAPELFRVAVLGTPEGRAEFFGSL